MALRDIPSPMTGILKELLVAPGTRIAIGEELCIIESMKMEIPVESPAAGILVEFLAAPAARIEEGDPLLRIEE